MYLLLYCESWLYHCTRSINNLLSEAMKVHNTQTQSHYTARFEINHRKIIDGHYGSSSSSIIFFSKYSLSQCVLFLFFYLTESCTLGVCIEIEGDILIIGEKRRREQRERREERQRNRWEKREESSSGAAGLSEDAALRTSALFCPAPQSEENKQRSLVGLI